MVSKKSQNVINIISSVSVIGVAVGTMALVIVLSVFNGFEDLVTSLYNSFDPDLQITLKEGKSFDAEKFPTEALRKTEGVAYLTETLEENALLKYRDKQYIATVKGVSTDFSRMTGLDSMIVEGKMRLEENGRSSAVVGNSIAYALGLNIDDFFNPITVYVPKHGKKISLNPEDAFNSRGISASGIFSIQQDFDSKYIVVPIQFIRELLSYRSEVTSIELGLSPDANLEDIQNRVQEIAGPAYIVKNRYQQHELLYKIMKSEKWAIYLILSFILLIATFSIIGSITMLIIDKKKDIAILWSMGAASEQLRRIFLTEGLMISVIGASAGAGLGYLICWLQQVFGIVKLQGSGSFVIDAYPVQMQALDFLYVFLTVLIIGFIAAWFPARQLIRKESVQILDL